MARDVAPWTAVRCGLALAAVGLLLSGCATYTWYRPDTPSDVVAQEETECSALARDAARDIAVSAYPRFYGPPWPYGPYAMWPGWGGWGDPFWSSMGGPLWRMDVEQRILDTCMRHRGYELQREPKA